MNKFRKSKINILIATDIAARGIDVSRVGLVLNYDLPESDEVYIHRIGRCGRAGSTGYALNDVNIKDRKTQELIESEFNKSINIIKPLQNSIQELENEINQIVYELYGLTDEEIVTIENSLEE